MPLRCRQSCGSGLNQEHTFEFAQNTEKLPYIEQVGGGGGGEARLVRFPKRVLERSNILRGLMCLALKFLVWVQCENA